MCTARFALALQVLSACCAHSAALLLRSCPVAAASSVRRLVASPQLTAGDGDEELDAADTVSSWDEELAMMKAWEAARKVEAGGRLAAESGSGVDEDAHLGLGEDFDSEDPAAAALRQAAEKQAAVLLAGIEAQSAAPPTDKAVMTSLEAVINAISRLSDKVDALTAKVDQLQQARPTAADASSSATEAPPAAAPPPPTAGAADDAPPVAASAAGGAAAADTSAQWDGEVDETAWFDQDDDDDDMPDWRDVRRLNKLL